MPRPRAGPAVHILELASRPEASIRLYYFTAKRWGLKALWEKRLKVSRYAEPMDLFELMGFDRSRATTRKVLDDRLAALEAGPEGRLCFSDRWQTTQLWSGFGDRHRGICLGFDVPRRRVRRVTYVSRPPALPAVAGARKQALSEALTRKDKAWRHEREWQWTVPLGHAHDGLYFRPFDDELHLREIILGARCTLDPLDIVDAVTNPPLDVEIFKARPAHDRFEVCRHELIDTHVAKGFRAGLEQSPDLYAPAFNEG